MKVRLKHLSVADAAALAPGAVRAAGGDAVEVEASHVLAVLNGERAARMAAVRAAVQPAHDPVVQGLLRHLGPDAADDARLSVEDHDGGLLVRGPHSLVQALLDRDAVRSEAEVEARRPRGGHADEP